MNRISQSLVAVCVAALALTAFTGDVQAQEDAVEDGGMDAKVGLIGGFDIDAEEPALGLDARFAMDLIDGVDVTVNPSLYTFPTLLGDAIQFQTSLNFLIEPELDAPVQPYVGPGLGIPLMLDPETDVDFGINAVAGVGFDLDAPVEPFAQFNFYRNISPGFNQMAALGGAHFVF